MNTISLAPIDLRSHSWSRLLGRFATRYFWLCVVGVLSLMACNGLWRLGDSSVRDHDEARYGVAASEMLHAHSLLVTTYAGETEFWNLKPPLGYWLLELSYRLVGETPFGLRLPAVICALLTTALTMILARRAAGPPAAVLAGLVLATSFGFLGHHGARSGDLDAQLTFLMLLLAMLAPYFVDSRPARLAAGLVMSMGFLLKSFAILPYVIAVAVYCLITRGMGSWIAWPLPVGITIVTTAIWAVARSAAEGSWEFVRRMFVEDLLLRSTTMIDPGGNSAWDYAGALFDRLAPWPAVALLGWGLSRPFARRQSPSGHEPPSGLETLMWCYALIPMILLTIARTHHSWYVIPTHPAWAILAAMGVREISSRAECTDLSTGFVSLVAVCVLACEARILVHIGLHNRMSPKQLFLASLPNRLGASERYLRTSFTPTYTERFFLQVVDGFHLLDLGTRDLRSDRARLISGPVLVRKSEAESMDLPPRAEGIAILERNEDYVLIRVSSPVAPATPTTALAGETRPTLSAN